MTDPVADMLTRIRNALQARHAEVRVPYSRFKHAIAEVLLREGYIAGVEVAGEPPKQELRIALKYIRKGKQLIPVITHIKRLSKPGGRMYVRATELPKPLSGLGIAIVSTSRGVLSDREARKQGVGGELICEVW